jgi:hypothetical protein
MCTVTSRESSHPERFSKEWRHAMLELNRDVYGVDYRPGRDLGVGWLLGHERHKSGEPHAHAIVYAMEHLNVLARRTDTKDRLFDRMGFARVEAVRSVDQVHAYATKYVLKGGELEFSDNFNSYVRFYRE